MKIITPEIFYKKLFLWDYLELWLSKNMS